MDSEHHGIILPVRKEEKSEVGMEAANRGNAAPAVRKAKSIHNLLSISSLATSRGFSKIPDRKESCDSLCGFLLKPFVLQNTATEGGSGSSTIWKGHQLQLLDWSSRGCMLSKQVVDVCMRARLSGMIRIMFEVDPYQSHVSLRFGRLEEEWSKPLPLKLDLYILADPGEFLF